MSWLLDLKNQCIAELAIKGSFLLHIANQFSAHTPSDFDAVFVVSGSRKNGESILQTMISRTAHVFGYQSMTEAQFSDMFYLKILRNDHGFSLKTSSGFYRDVKSPLYGRQPFPSYLPIDIDVVLTDEDPRKTMIKLWTMDSLNTSHRLIYPVSPHAKAEIVTRVIALPLIESLLAKNLLLVGPGHNTLDLFRLIKFRQRGYAFIEPNLERKCIENTISNFSEFGFQFQDGFIQRAKGVLTAIIKQNDTASLSAFCDIFDKLYTVLISRQVHQRMNASLLEIKNESQRVLYSMGVGYHPAVTTFAARAETLNLVFGHLSHIEDQPHLLALAGYVLISDLSCTAPETFEADAVVTALYRYLDPKDFGEQQISDKRVLTCLKKFGANISDTVCEAIEKTDFFSTRNLSAQDHAVLSLLAERGSYPARLALKRHTFLEKKEQGIFAKKQNVFDLIRNHSDRAKSYKVMGTLRIKRYFFSRLHQKTTANKLAMQTVHSMYHKKNVIQKWHAFTVENRLETRLNRLQKIYQKRCQIAKKESLKTEFIHFKVSLNATYTQNLKDSLFAHLAISGFVSNGAPTLENIQRDYLRFLRVRVSQEIAFDDLETFIDKQIPTIQFMRHTLKKDISDIFLSKKDLRFISQPTLDRLNKALNTNRKIENPLGIGYWSVASAQLFGNRFKELETHAHKKSGLTDKFCDFFYHLESKHQTGYIKHFSEANNLTWSTPILKTLFWKAPAEFINSFAKWVSPDKLECFLVDVPPLELDGLHHTLSAACESASLNQRGNLEFAQLCIIELRLQSKASTPKELISVLGDSLVTLIDNPEFKDSNSFREIQKIYDAKNNRKILYAIRGTAIILGCLAGHLYKNSKHQNEALILGGIALYCLQKSFQYDTGA